MAKLEEKFHTNCFTLTLDVRKRPSAFAMHYYKYLKYFSGSAPINLFFSGSPELFLKEEKVVGSIRKASLIKILK